LRRWEIQINEGGSRYHNLKQISKYILNNFNIALEKGIIIHDIDLARWTVRAQEDLNIPGFKASMRWIQKFKVIHNIVSRKTEVPKLFFLIDHFQNFAGSGGPPAATFLPYSQNSTKNVKIRSNYGNLRRG